MTYQMAVTGEKPFDRVMVIAVRGEADTFLAAAIQGNDPRYIATSIEDGDIRIISTAPWPRNPSPSSPEANCQ